MPNKPVITIGVAAEFKDKEYIKLLAEALKLKLEQDEVEAEVIVTETYA